MYKLQPKANHLHSPLFHILGNGFLCLILFMKRNQSLRKLITFIIINTIGYNCGQL